MKKYLLSAVLALSVPFVTQATDAMNPEIRVFGSDFTQLNSFSALDGTFDGGLDVAMADTDGDGNDEIIVGTGRGGAPLVQIFDGDGRLLNQWYAYDQSLRTGIHVAAGDLNKDGKAEIITGAASGGGPQVRVFSATGKPQFGAGFFAFDAHFRGGVDVAVGDYNGDGKMEIAAAAGPGGSPHVRLFNRKGQFLGTEFRPFAADNKGGVSLATANVDGGMDDELVMSVYSAGEDWVKVYKNNGVVLGEWKNFPGLYTGVVVAAGDVDADGKDEIAVSPRQGAGPQVLFYEGYGASVGGGFFAYNQDFRGGLNIASGDIDGNGTVEWVTVPGKNRAQGRADLVRYIDVDLSEQTTRVYEYGELVHEFKISSGVARHPTTLGNFTVLRKIYVKDYKWDYGEGNPDNYDIKNVHWNLLFNAPDHQYLHYAYWHHNFGHPMSHGCINIDATNAEWIYNWAQVGDPVIVHQ